MSAIPAIDYTVTLDPKGPIVLVPYIHAPFIHVMDSFFPALVSHSGDRKGEGYSAYLLQNDKLDFIGSFTGMCLASVRKNPWFEDKEQWFLRALLGGMHLKGYETDHRSRCHRDNYGTLRLWQKLGLGAKRTMRGDYISQTADEASVAELLRAIEYAKVGYSDLRAFAEKRRSMIPQKALESILPPASLAFEKSATRLSVTLKS